MRPNNKALERLKPLQDQAQASTSSSQKTITTGPATNMEDDDDIDTRTPAEKTELLEWAERLMREESFEFYPGARGAVFAPVDPPSRPSPSSQNTTTSPLTNMMDDDIDTRTPAEKAQLLDWAEEHMRRESFEFYPGASIVRQSCENPKVLPLDQVDTSPNRCSSRSSIRQERCDGPVIQTVAGVSENHNHANYQARLDYVKQVVGSHLGLSEKERQQIEITPIQYEPDFPFRYNNFVYRISLPPDVSCHLGGAAAAAGDYNPKQPGCVPIPADTKKFILRLSNPDAEGLRQQTRVQNEVGILTLAAAALRHVEPNVVPRVFGWGGGGASRERPGWILEELMPGAPLAEAFAQTMSLDQKRGIMAQMATILKALQDYPLPGSIKGLGGVTFDDDNGDLVSAPMTSVEAGPWSSFEDSYRGRLGVALVKADKNPRLEGWRANGVRARVEAFIEQGLSARFSDLASKQDKAIVHADFTADNLLYDPATGRVTALLDYDFSSILHPAYEFFRSFSTNGGTLTGWLGDTTAQEKDAAAFRDAKLSGRFPTPLPTPVPTANGPGVDWELAQVWEDELQKVGAKRPSTSQGIDKVTDVNELLGALVPWRLTNEDYLRMNPDEEETRAVRDMYEKQLVGLLNHMGF